MPNAQAFTSRPCGRAALASIALVLAVLHVAPASATENCVIGAFADPGGNQATLLWEPFLPFDFYVVIRDEAAINGASFLLEYPATAIAVTPGSGAYGPDGNGLSLVSPGGENVGFSNCAFAYGGGAVVIARYQSIIPNYQYRHVFKVLPNVDENPEEPIYATCNGMLEPCPYSQEFEVLIEIAVDAKSFAAVKALY